MNYYKRTTIRCPSLVGLLATVVLVASPQILVAEIFVNPPPLGAYYWQGSHNGNQIGHLVGNDSPHIFTGGGDAANWARHWNGRYQVDADSDCPENCQPGTFKGLAPQDGDFIFFKDSLIPADVEGPYSISGGSISLPSSYVAFEIHADFSGGSYDVAVIDIWTRSIAVHTGTFPVNFSDTAFRGNQTFTANAVHDTLTFQGATIDSPLIELNGSFTIEAPTPPPDGTPLISITGGSQVLGGVIKSSRGFTRLSESFMRGFGMEVGFSGEAAPAEVTLTNQSDAIFTQFLVVGKEGRGAVALEGTSKMISPEAYGIIGAEGVGSFRISDHSEVELDRIQIGENETGDVAIDTTGKLITNDGILGERQDKQGTANVESHGLWETDNLTIGKDGIGYLYIRDEGTVKIEEEAILGESATGHGFLSLIGPNSKLELAQGGSLTIGQEGTGELSLSEGAKFTSSDEVKLGEMNGSTGIVSVFGSGSVWEIEGDLNVGNGDGSGTAHGEVTVESGGELKVGELSTIRVGRLEHSVGKMTLRGASSKITGVTGTAVPLEIGSAGTGTLQIEEGFKLSLGGKKMTLGVESTGNGTVKLTGDGSELTVNNLTIGENSKGLFEVADHGKLIVTGTEMWIGKEQGSDGTLRIKDSGSQLEFAGKFSIGDNGKGTLELNDGAQIATDTLTLGKFAGSEGVVSLDNAQTGGTTKFETTGELILGNEGRGVLNVAVGSRMDVGTHAILAKQTGSHAEVNIQNLTSTWDIDGDLTVGNFGDATVTLKKGLVDVKGDLILGDQAGSHGTFFVEDSENLRGLKLRKGLVIGKAGHGMLSVVDGGKVDLSELGSFDGIVTLGQMQHSNGLAIIEGGQSQLIATALVVGERGTGSVNVNDHGKLTVLETLEIGNGFDSIGSMEITGQGSTLLVAGNTTLGENGRGTLTLSDHASATLEGTVSIGDPGSVGVQDSKVTVAGNATLAAVNNDLIIRHRGTLEVTGAGSEASFADVTVSGRLGPLASLNIASQGKVKADDVLLREAALTISDEGTLESRSLQVLDQATVNVSGGGSKISQVSVIRVGTTSAGEMSLASGGNLDFGSAQDTLEIGAQGKLTMGDNTSVQMNLGLISIQGVAELTGVGSHINNPGGSIGVAGTLKIAAGSNGIKAASINVGSTGKVYAASVADQVHGRIVGKVSNAGTLIVGQSPGVMVIEGDYEQTSGGALELEIGGLTPGEQFDQLVVTGSAIIDGALNLAIINSGGGFHLPTVGDQFSLLTAQGGITGAFDNVASLRSVAGGSLVHWSLESSGDVMVLEAASIIPLHDGDYNANGIVDASDYVVWRHLQGSINLAADGNRDGVIDSLDFGVWRANFGRTANSGSGASPNTAVPEPATCVLLVIAAAAGCPRRSRAV